ncbi:MAG: arginine--tRNA ligase [Candidatus Marinimicrobia bacterium]|jgi:arginyl-tRNA synthetase|nr:arginine--tRNA ligase [Candidatus Neomarinimicrobiota bacterium]MBT3675496.1 arginine--tRNA ligase [Candidatus Neomarinimicrobiota bacterium]MBT3762792.1 arginine--tRNA ligase [Candidatus Neomarinimicrobiota bacterium]MBT4069272.1 arginine--tRNA ligase [Candidatus Neomarinimicrobiota bacterium]MBT4270413.1 arginine--tRNA ligase [Candidatus Neomarinimicrobiota bacterium]
MTILSQLIQALTDSLTALGLPERDIKLSPPNNPDFGDLSTNVALTLAKDAQKNPIQIANDIKNGLNLPDGLIEEVSVTPPGFLNFKIGINYYHQVLSKILSNNNFGRGRTGEGKKANVEFVSANPTGPLTVGHGRNAVLGDTISNILEWNGYDVTREYYFNDAGRQMRILGQSVEARYFEILGKNSEFPEDGYEGNYIKDIAQTVIDEFGNKLLSKDGRFKAQAEKAIFADIEKSLLMLGIHFDQFTNEKTFYENGEIDRFLEELKTKDLIYEKDGATWFRSTALGKEQDRVYIKSTGEPTYRVPDTAYHRDKINRGFDLIIDVFGADHADTYPDVLLALEALGLKTDHIRVLLYQFVTLLRGGEKVKMSTRKANFVTMNELVDEVGADVVRFFFIMRGMNSHLNFDLDLAADQSEKNPVFYLQYAHARICNIIKHGDAMGFSIQSEYDPKLLNNPVEVRLLKRLEKFPAIVENALQSLEPQTISIYLHDTANRFHKFYSECRVITDDIALSSARIALVSATRTVIANGLDLLGLSAPERM